MRLRCPASSLHSFTQFKALTLDPGQSRSLVDPLDFCDVGVGYRSLIKKKEKCLWFRWCWCCWPFPCTATMWWWSLEDDTTTMLDRPTLSFLQWRWIIFENKLTALLRGWGWVKISIIAHHIQVVGPNHVCTLPDLPESRWSPTICYFFPKARAQYDVFPKEKSFWKTRPQYFDVFPQEKEKNVDRHGHSAVRLGNSVLVCGGLSGHHVLERSWHSLCTFELRQFKVA